MRTAKTLIRLAGCPCWSESSLGAQPFCWFYNVAAQMTVSSSEDSDQSVHLHSQISLRFAFMRTAKPSIRPPVNLVSLSHLLRGNWSDVFDICLRCSPSGLVMSVRKWFRSVDRYGRRRPSLIFTVIASHPKPLEEFCRNLAYKFFSMSKCPADCPAENYSGPARNMAERQPSFKSLITLYLTL